MGVSHTQSILAMQTYLKSLELKNVDLNLTKLYFKTIQSQFIQW